MGSKEEPGMSLVLSIFKGENFVCKTHGGFRCQIEAKCCGKSVLSSVIPISPTNSEPIFNSQLAWQLSRQELRELRGNKEPVKVKCLITSDDSEKPTELGYSILYVKEAVPLSVANLDPTKAKSYPLLGTRDQWKIYHPKLYMQLHIEEMDQPKQKSEQSNNANANVKKTHKLEAGPSTLSLNSVKNPPVEDWRAGNLDAEISSWRINENDGCFELGSKADGDDLYLFNITIISSSYLHLLWNGRSPKKPADDDYVWQVKYNAYGCEIKSDPFPLSQDNESRRTFIGDKATARIRANSAVFCEYLLKTSVEFQVTRFQIGPFNDIENEEVMGFGSVDLKELAQSSSNEMKATLEITSELGYSQTVTGTAKPEVRVIFQLDATPGYFKPGAIAKGIQKLLGDHSPSKTSTNHPENDVDMDNNNEVPSPPSKDTSRHDPSVDLILQELNDFVIAENQFNNDTPEYERMNKNKSSPASNQYYSHGNDERSRTSASSAQNQNQNSKSKVVQHSPVIPQQRKFGNNNNGPVTAESDINAESDSAGANVSVGKSETSNRFSSPEKLSELPLDETEDSDSESECSKENVDLSLNLPPAGTYEVTISLTEVLIKTRTPYTEDDKIVLSYIHPTFGIIDDPFICTARIDRRRQNKPKYQSMIIEDGTGSTSVSFGKFSEKIINEPLIVELRKYNRDFVEPVFAFSMIPVGNVLLRNASKKVRRLTGVADVLKSGTNMKIGRLNYKIRFTSEMQMELSSISPIKEIKINQRGNHLHYSPEKPVRTEMPNFRTLEEIGAWKEGQKEQYVNELKKKERAYLLILAQEAADRDKQREKVMKEKLSELRKKEKELQQKGVAISEREEKVRSQEIELATSTQRASLDHTSILENAKLTIKRLQEEHKIEISLLKRRNEEFEAELVKWKGKLNLMEKKLEEKDEYISRLKSEKHNHAEFNLPEKFKLLEHENKLLRRQNTDAEKARDQYKKQSQTLCQKLARLQEERDKQLKDENESLRLQIIASKQHKEMKKDRKAVVDISQQIKSMQQDSSNNNKSKTPPVNSNIVTKSKKSENSRNNENNSPNRKSDSNQDEIKRLQQVRNGLLTTGAYTQYDMVIKEMERRIVGLAEGNIVS